MGIGGYKGDRLSSVLPAHNGHSALHPHPPTLSKKSVEFHVL